MALKGFLEEFQVVEGFLPVNMATGANDGDWVSLKNFGKCIVLFYGAPGASAEPVTITLQQAKDVSGGSAKALAITKYGKKQAATNLQAVGEFTRVTQAAANTIALGSGADGDKASIVVVEINAEDLDADGGFDCLRATVADVGLTAQNGALLYLLANPRTSPPPSSLTN